MNYQHKQLAAGRWNQFNFLEQMANIGSEVERYLGWKAKDNINYSQKAFERALELLDLTMSDLKNRPKLKELARVRESLVDYFLGINQFVSTEASWKKYFSCFTYAARRNK